MCEAIAVAVQLEDVDVMGQPVEQREPTTLGPSRQRPPETRPIARYRTGIDLPCDPAPSPRSAAVYPTAFTIQTANVGNPRALCARILAALSAARDDEPDWAERLLTAVVGGGIPGWPIYSVVDNDAGATDQRMRVKLRVC